jgi:hypothetical protein
VPVGRGQPGPEGHQLFRLFIAQRPQKNGVDDAEDGGVSADAERQRQHRDRGKARAPKQRSKGVAEVLKQGAHLIHSEGR